MSNQEKTSLVPSAYADDEEIGRYAELLNTLGVGLIVYTPTASLLFHNTCAEKLLGQSPFPWKNATGQTIADAELPHKTVLRSGNPVFDQIMTLSKDDRTTWVNTNALPVLAANGSVRRVLLTLTNITEDHERQQDISALRIRDPLTGAFNSTETRLLLENELCRAQRYGTPFTLAQLNIDHFNALGKQYGTTTCQVILAEVGKLLCSSAREMDLVGRTGEHEFLLIMPNVRLNDAIIGVERLRASIDEHRFTPDNLHVTLSGGVTEYAGENATQLIERTSSLLACAREAGHNRLCQDVEMF
ncbi:MAG: diguanylate cyclase [Betaproteobacteria bacterium]